LSLLFWVLLGVFCGAPPPKKHPQFLLELRNFYK
jgi:hypothetical protein